MRDRPRRNRSGFSLTELLVVMGIIGLLIAILMPAISRARQQSLVVKCASNLRQIGMAIETYHQTYQRLPYASPPLSAALAEIKNYTPDTFVCPESGTSRRDDYQMNEAFAGLPKSAGNPVDVLACEVAETLPVTGSQKGGASPQLPAGRRHRGKLNVLFFDGHVDALSKIPA
jgi:prepilin-type processing-associated H-X9-DG protein/prepilin-type N-terminal cleavage/methylation domain-containing protein